MKKKPVTKAYRPKIKTDKKGVPIGYTSPKDEIRARLVVYGIGEMSKKEWSFFKKWIRMVASEFKTTEREAFNQKRFRHTLYKRTN